MILAMGIGSWIGGLFHLITHAFFKALLFLGSGSVIHAAHHEQEMPQYGGLIRKIPVTGITFGIAVLAIAGFSVAGWGFAGFYSKDMILAHAGAFGYLAESEGLSKGYWLLFQLPTIIAYVTAFYMTRCWMLTFAGKPRNQHVYDHAREAPIMWLPLVMLALLSIFGGKYLGVSELLQSGIRESTQYCRAIVPKFNGFGTAWPAEASGAEGGEATAHAEVASTPELMEKGHELMHHSVGWAWLVGIGLGVIIYWNGYWIAGPLMKIPPLNYIRIWLYRRMYFDELYFSVFVAIVMALSWTSAMFDKYVVDGIVNLVGGLVKRSAFLAGWHDKYVVDGAVNGLATLSHDLGAAVRAPQTGRIRMYVTVLMVAIGLGLAGAIIVVLSR
jgi:NADH-quinone oxidoreductase subunit L